MPDRYRVEEVGLPAELRAEHAKLMDTPMSEWPPDLRVFVTSLSPVNCGQVLANRVGAWLYGKGEATGA